MRTMVFAGLQQAYGNLVRMIAEFLPRFLVMVLIILAGWLIAWLLKHVVRGVLHLTQLDQLSEKAGASRVLRRAALPSMTEFLSRFIFWVVLLGFTLVGIGVLGIPELHDQLTRLFQLLPEILVAIFILFIGMLAANFLSRAALLAAVNAGSRSPQLLSSAIRSVIWILALTMALEQVGIARQTVVAAFSIVFGALMFGLAIAFGLGGQELARQLLEKYLGEQRKEKVKEEEPTPF